MDEIVAKVVSVLGERGRYRELSSPLKVADLEFRFDCVLAGPSNHDGLVIITTLTDTARAFLLRQIRGLVTLLDRLGSTRTISVVVVVRGQTSVDIAALETYCHVVVVRPDLSLERSLRTLLPLVLPVPGKHTTSAANALETELGPDANDLFIKSLLIAAGEGNEAVNTLIAKALDDCFDDTIVEGQS